MGRFTPFLVIVFIQKLIRFFAKELDEEESSLDSEDSHKEHGQDFVSVRGSVTAPEDDVGSGLSSSEKKDYALLQRETIVTNEGTEEHNLFIETRHNRT